MPAGAGERPLSDFVEPEAELLTAGNVEWQRKKPAFVWQGNFVDGVMHTKGQTHSLHLLFAFQKGLCNSNPSAGERGFKTKGFARIDDDATVASDLKRNLKRDLTVAGVRVVGIKHWVDAEHQLHLFLAFDEATPRNEVQWAFVNLCAYSALCTRLFVCTRNFDLMRQRCTAFDGHLDLP
jgi:hypothetical protein